MRPLARLVRALLLLVFLSLGAPPGNAAPSALACDHVGWPTHVSPADGASLGSWDITLDWTDVGGAEYYHVQLSDAADFSNLLVNLEVWHSPSEYPVWFPLPPGTYYWRVKSLCYPYESNYTVAWSFHVCSPDRTTLVSPFAETFAPTGIPLQWTAVTGAIEYQVQVDDAYDFSSVDLSVATNGTSYTIPGPLAPDFYHWRVRAGNECGYGLWSENAGSFTICGEPPPELPDLWSPEDDATVCVTGSHLDWNGCFPCTAHQVQVDREGTFVTPVYSATLTHQRYDFPGTLLEGTYYWRVRYCNPCGDGPWSLTRSFVAEALPAQPDLVSPDDGTIRGGVNVTLNWADLDAADSYRVELDDTDSFVGLVYSATVAVSQSSIPGALAPGDYYWRVRAANVCGDGPWSATWALHICASPAQPGLIWPPDGTLAPRIDALFDWTTVSGATRYRLEVDDSTFFSGAIITETKVSSCTLPGPLDMGMTYYWRVRAYNNCTWGPYSGTDSFYTCLKGPTGEPELLAPPDGAALLPSGIILDWSDVAGATMYRAEIDDDTGFSPALYSAELPASRYAIETSLATGTYYWRVRPENDCGPGDWSPFASFRVKAGVYLPLVLRGGP